jgi:hypothetical protein
MSIVALKRKSQRFIKPISHNQGNNGFALNGALRNVGWVGQTSLSRIGVTSSCFAEDPSVVKKSTQNTLGHLSARVRYPVSAGCSQGKCDALFNVMNESKKLTFICGDRSASAYTDNIANSVETCFDGSNCNTQSNITVINNPNAFKSTIPCPPVGTCKANSYYIGGRLVYNKPYNKNVESFSAITAGDYIRRINKIVPTTEGVVPIANENHFGISY